MSKALPPFLCDLLAAPPRSGDGVHQWIYRMARQLHVHRSEIEICDLLGAALDGCGRVVSAKEIADAVRNSKATAWQPTYAGSQTPRPPTSRSWPGVDAVRRENVLTEMNGAAVANLRALSPFQLDTDKAQTNRIVAALFPPDSLLCAAMENWSAVTKPLSELLCNDMSNFQFIVPNPMSAITGTSQGNKVSSRCLNNTGPRRFLVVECDHGSIDEQAAILLWLARQAPLALAVHSGGKSLHGWFYCRGQPEDKLRAFMHLAVSLGADSRMWTACQLARMPDGNRLPSPERGPTRQRVQFFNPSVCNEE